MFWFGDKQPFCAPKQLPSMILGNRTAQKNRGRRDIEVHISFARPSNTRPSPTAASLFMDAKSPIFFADPLDLMMKPTLHQSLQELLQLDLLYASDGEKGTQLITAKQNFPKQ